MTPEAYFKQVFELDRKINSKISERDAILNTLTGATTMQENPTYSNQFYSSTENAVMKLMEFNDKTNKHIDKLVNLKIQMSHELNMLPKHSQQLVLRERYLCSKKFEEIAVEQNYSYSHVTYLHRTGLEKFGEVHKEKLKKMNETK